LWTTTKNRKKKIYSQMIEGGAVIAWDLKNHQTAIKQKSTHGGARTRNPQIRSLVRYHCATRASQLLINFGMTSMAKYYFLA
jgi:hypothetical protein